MSQHKSMTTKEIIKILPINDALKRKLFEGYDTMPEAEKSVLVELLWDMYDALYQLLLEKNLALARVDLENNKRDINPDFFRAVEEQTLKDMQEEGTQEITDIDLSQAREKLEALVQEKKN